MQRLLLISEFGISIFRYVYFNGTQEGSAVSDLENLKVFDFLLPPGLSRKLMWF